jgi:hypothetical protein
MHFEIWYRKIERQDLKCRMIVCIKLAEHCTIFGEYIINSGNRNDLIYMSGLEGVIDVKGTIPWRVKALSAYKYVWVVSPYLTNR